MSRRRSYPFEVVLRCTDGIDRSVKVHAANRTEAKAEAVCLLEYRGLGKTGIVAEALVAVNVLPNGARQ